MIGKTIAVLENRYGEELAGLLTRRGALVLHAPALAELPDYDAQYIAQLVERLAHATPRAFIFQTGVGTQALFNATDERGVTPQLLAVLAQTVVVARGPKPAGPLRGRGVRVDCNARSPYTTNELLDAMRDVPVDGDVVVQRYGGVNRELDVALEARGARVIEVPVYRWAVPADTAPLIQLLDALALGRVDAVAFTNAAQVRNLHTLADTLGRRSALDAALAGVLIAAIGPVCSKALADYGVTVGIEASPPKLGPFVQALDRALGGNALDA